MEINNETTIDEKYAKAIEYLKDHQTISISVYGLDVTNFKALNNVHIKQQVIDLVDSIISMKNEESKVRKRCTNKRS